MATGIDHKTRLYSKTHHCSHRSPKEKMRVKVRRTIQHPCLMKMMMAIFSLVNRDVVVVVVIGCYGYRHVLLLATVVTAVYNKEIR